MKHTNEKCHTPRINRWSKPNKRVVCKCGKNYLLVKQTKTFSFDKDSYKWELVLSIEEQMKNNFGYFKQEIRSLYEEIRRLREQISNNGIEYRNEVQRFIAQQNINFSEHKYQVEVRFFNPLVSELQKKIDKDDVLKSAIKKGKK